VKKHDNNDLVSIIMPVYNSEKFIEYSIKSVLSQSYKNWELIIVDDCSTDKTSYIVEHFKQKEKRIRYCKLESNSGAAMARNKAIDVAQGRFIAFLDSDDIWTEHKLLKQIEHMKLNSYNFTCTSRERIDEFGNTLNKIRKVKKRAAYNEVLLSCPIGNSTVIYDAYALGKFRIPDIRKRNDYVLWLQILKKEKYIYGIDEVLAYTRKSNKSLSSDKFSLVKHHWKIYRDYENLSIIRSIFHVFIWGLISVFGLKK
jgi:teichuronic acid biosynthesis glycosyltransferase TuaG